MGEVFLARDRRRRHVALKVITAELASEPEFRQRFAKEIEALERVKGPGIATIVDADIDGDPAWLATEFIDGPTLASHLAGTGPLRGPTLRSFAVSLLQSLQTIHAQGVIHRDLKPTNVILTPTRPVLIDFGIAQIAGATSLTAADVRIGTPGWMSPEQITGARAGPPSDVFGWAALVHYAATGQHPFGVGPTEAMLYRIVHSEPAAIATGDPQIDTAVRKSLAKSPLERPRIVDTLHEVARDTASDPTEIARTWVMPTGLEPKRPTWRRAPATATIVFAALVAVLLGGIYLNEWRDSESAPASDGEPAGAPVGTNNEPSPTAAAAGTADARPAVDSTVAERVEPPRTTTTSEAPVAVMTSDTRSAAPSTGPTLDDLITDPLVVGFVGPLGMPDGTQAAVISRLDAPALSPTAPGTVELALEGPAGWAIEQSIEVHNPAGPVMTGDLDGDGRSEIIVTLGTTDGSYRWDALFRLDGEARELTEIPYDTSAAAAILGDTMVGVTIYSVEAGVVSTAAVACLPSCAEDLGSAVDWRLNRSGPWELQPIDPVISSNEPFDLVHSTFDDYVTGVNTGDYARAQQRRAPERRIDLDEWSEEMATSYISDLTIHSVDTTGDETRAWITFTSTQAPDRGPRPGETCTRWSIDYTLVPADDGLLWITSGDGHAGSPLSEPCG